MTEETLIKERLRKLGEIREHGIEPYPYSYQQKDHAADIQKEHAGLDKEQKTRKRAKVAGRVMTLRRMGKVTFATLQDQTGKVQLYFRHDDIGKKKYNFLKLLDIGDIIGAEGIIFKTKMGEVTVYVDSYDLLTKSLRPLPEKFHGLKDDEIKYRKRHLDLIMNPEVKELLVKKSIIIDSMREFLKKKGFVEIETPTLQVQYGGANARPFKTRINAWDMDMFLSISPELYLKRLVVGGFEKVFTICKNFRNEGVDAFHNPEFTMMECYWAYADYGDMMKLTDEMVEYCCKKANGTTKVEYGGKKIDFKAPWKRLSMKDALKKHAEIDVDKLKDAELFEMKNNYNLKHDGELTRGVMIQLLFEKLVEDKLVGPVHIIDHPIESTPLCKPKRGNPELIERFESFVAGKELTNAYSDLNDPVLQRKLLEDQARQLRGGAEEAHPMDEDFVEAIETGMPPAGGMGLGVDRLVLFLTGAKSLREIIPFPTMKPEENQHGSK